MALHNSIVFSSPFCSSLENVTLSKGGESLKKKKKMSLLDLEFLKKKNNYSQTSELVQGDAAAHKIYKAYDKNQRHSQHCQHRFSLLFVCFKCLLVQLIR